MGKYDCLKLENQLCFPLYVCSKEIIRRYKPLLDKIDLTYTQYIAMMVLWEHNEISVSELGDYLYLDSGTLTPLLKKLESKGYLKREKNNSDERSIVIKVTQSGMNLRNEALMIPENIVKCVNLDEKDAKTLYNILYKIIKED